MRYRKANMNDAERLLLWRNDKLTVENFRSNRPVSRVEHSAWLRNRMHPDTRSRVFIIDIDGMEIGTVSMEPMEYKEHGFEVSVTIAPGQRGQGFGGKALRLVCNDFPEETLYTEIKYSNKGSMKSFEAAGFAQIGSYGLWTQWRRMPLK